MTTVYFYDLGRRPATEATRTLVQRARDAGCEFRLAEDGVLVVRAAKGVLTEERLDRISKAGGAIVDLLMGSEA